MPELCLLTRTLFNESKKSMSPLAVELVMMALVGGISYLLSGWGYRSELKHLKRRSALLELLRDQRLQDANSGIVEAQDGL